MRFHLRTTWLEIGAGFHLLFAAVAVYTQRYKVGLFGYLDFPQDFGASLMLLAACAVFLLHPLKASLRIRRGLLLFAGTIAALGVTVFLTAGNFGFAALQIGYAAWLLGAVFLPRLDTHITSTDEVPVSGIDLIYGAVLVAIGVNVLLHGAFVSWRASLAAAWSIAAGAAMAYTLVPGRSRARPAAVVLGAMAFLYHGVTAFALGDVGFGGALLAAFSLLLLSSVGGGRLFEAADDLSGATPRQREIYVYERAEETTMWVSVALSSIFMNFIEFSDARLYFTAILSIAFITQYSYRFRPATTISGRRHLLTLVAVVISSIVLISATGGVLGPLVYLAYILVFVGTVAIRPAWSIAIAAIYAGYVSLELVWHLTSLQAEPTDGHTAHYIFLVLTLMFTGLYAAWTGRRRIRMNDVMSAANRRLSEALREAVRERERYGRQARDLKNINQDLIEMRSALMNVLEDVEESKRHIEAERRRELASFDALTEGIMTAGKDGRIFLCNPTAARLLGMSAETVLGQPIEQVLRLFQEEGAVMQTRAFENAYEGRTASLGERIRLMRADGIYMPVAGNVAPYLDEENRTAGIVAVFRDVTDEREIDRQKSDFISIASHQLRSPLSALRWFLDLLLAGDTGHLNPTQKEYLGDMSASVERMVKLVGDLLDVSRIESGKTKMKPELVDTRKFVESMARDFMPLVQRQGVTFTSSVAKDAVTFYADPGQAYQAIANVIDNAVRYTPTGGSITLDVKVEGSETVFKLKDTGLGIPKNQQYRVYDKFFRGENVVAKETLGSGLGLYVVKTIIDLSGGRIRFESDEKKGTTFFLSFPNGPKAPPA